MKQKPVDIRELTKKDAENAICVQTAAPEFPSTGYVYAFCGRAARKTGTRKAKNPCRFPCRGFTKVAVKKRFEPVSVACQSVPNPLNTGLPLPSPARFVAIRLYDFDTFSTLR